MREMRARKILNTIIRDARIKTRSCYKGRQDRMAKMSSFRRLVHRLRLANRSALLNRGLRGAAMRMSVAAWETIFIPKQIQRIE